MFCYQCQEAAGGKGCTVIGTCGKDDSTAKLQDMLLYVTKGISVAAEKINSEGHDVARADLFITEALFLTITNVNFDADLFTEKINEAIRVRDELKKEAAGKGISLPESDELVFTADGKRELLNKAELIGILAEKNEDIRSLKELLIYGIKGMAAYHYHSERLGYTGADIYVFQRKALAEVTRNDITADELLGLILEAGKYGVDVLALLDKANTETYGNPEITSVELGVRNNPGILVSGHDLKDLEELLKQSENSGIDIYTHGEMLPAQYYPAFKKYKHFAGNYGNAWWQQKEEFTAFNGPVLMTTNCLVPPAATYADRVYTTGPVGFPGLKHIPEPDAGKEKDFSGLIEAAKKSAPPAELETGTITGGFAHNTVLSLADKVIDAVKTGAVKKFVVMAGCDGRVKKRNYYTDFADELPDDSIILTAGCAKYRYNKLQLGDIGGIPRVLDAGQCNDSYSLAVVALKLKEVFGLEDINDLPISYNIAWYEQKAVIVLLALLHLGVKNIHLGPTLPAFLSPGVTKILVETFGIGGITTPAEDVVKMTA